MAKEGQKKTVELKEEKYTMQNPGVRWYIKHSDRCRDRFGMMSREKYISGLLDNVILQPIKIENFDDKSEDKKEVSIDGNKYTLVYKGNRWLIETEDKSKNDEGQFSQEIYIDNLLKDGLDNEINMDDFDKLSNVRDLVSKIESYNRSKELQELVKEVESFLGA